MSDAHGHQPGHQPGHEHGHGHHGAFDTPEAAERTELEGEVLVGFARTAAAEVAARASRAGLLVERILDLGSGPGVGTCVWAAAFPGATVTAVDASAAMLERAAARAEQLGLAHRVTTELFDMAGELGSLGRHDVVYASMSMHHVGDEVKALASIRDVLAPNGLVVLLERAGHVDVRFADDPPGTTELWSMVNQAWSAWFADMRAALPGSVASMGYPEMFAAAGYEVLTDDVVEIKLKAPLSAPARRFARARMERSQTELADYADQTTLTKIQAILADLDGARSNRWDSAEVTTAQRLLIARLR